MSGLNAWIADAGYGKRSVLKNIAISAEEGEVVALIGPNGAGKSTLLKVLMGIVKTRSGRVIVNGVAVTNRAPEINVRDGISFVPQGNRVFGELSIRDNLEIGGYLLSGRAKLDERLDWVLGLFPELKGRLRGRASGLSGGEKQQLALARALMLRPKILLLDEPSLGLARGLVTKAFDHIGMVNQQFRTTIVIVEQNVGQVLRIADRVYAMRIGEIVFEGSPSQLQEGDKLRRIFLV